MQNHAGFGAHTYVSKESVNRKLNRVLFLGKGKAKGECKTIKRCQGPQSIGNPLFLMLHGKYLRVRCSISTSYIYFLTM